MARPQKFRHSREALSDPQIAEKLGRFVLDIEALRQTRKQIDDQIAAAYDAVDDGGFEKKFVRKVVSLRAKETDKRRDEEEGLEVYELAIEKGVSLACVRRKPELPAHDPETGEIIESTPHSERSHDAARPSASTGNASGEIPAINSPSAISTRTVEETAEPAVATTPSPRATADQFSRAPVESIPLHEQADVKTSGSYPCEAASGAPEKVQLPNQQTGCQSSSPSTGSSSRPSSLAGEVGKSSLTSPAFSNPRCRKPDSCHFAHSRDCCHDCLLAWGSKPRDEQRRLWQEAERAARECEVAA